MRSPSCTTNRQLPDCELPGSPHSPRGVIDAARWMCAAYRYWSSSTSILTRQERRPRHVLPPFSFLPSWPVCHVALSPSPRSGHAMQPSGTCHTHMIQGHGVHVPVSPSPISAGCDFEISAAMIFLHSAARDHSALPSGLDPVSCGWGGMGGWLAVRVMLMSTLCPCRFVNSRVGGDTFGVPDTQLGAHRTARAAYCM